MKITDLLSEVSLGDYTKKAQLSRGLASMEKHVLLLMEMLISDPKWIIKC